MTKQPAQNVQSTAARPPRTQAGGRKPRHMFLSESGRSGMDMPFLIAVLLLLAFGLVMLWSVSYPVAYFRKNDSLFFIKKQLLFAGAGLAAMLLVSRLDYHFLRRFVWVAYFGVLVLLVITLFMPPLNNARRWILVPPQNAVISFQTSELAKLEIILAFAHLGSLNQSRIKTFRYGVLPYMMVLVPIVVLVVVEPHLSGTILLISLAAILMFSGGTSIKWFVLAFGSVVAALVLALIIKPDIVPVAEERIAMWQHPELDPTDKGMQTLQGLMAIGSGGITGLGLGNSRQKYMYVPEPYNDAIFTIICEELGFVGAIIILLLFAFFMVRGIYVALHAKDRFGQLLVTGVVAQIMLQVTLNVMVVTNTIPYTGITLPFFSYGGTSLSLLLAETGLVLSVSRQANIRR